MRLVASALAGALLLASCATLPSLEANNCGNGVVEPGHGEDCDGFAKAAGTFCRPQGAVGECRFDCSADAQHVCPAGYGCGKDAICRVGSGKFGKAVAIPSGGATRLSSGDFDGDGNVDVVAESAFDVRIDYFDDAFVLGSTLRIPLDRAHAAVAQFAGEPRAGLVLSSGGGVDAWHGRTDRTLAPTVFPAFPVPGAALRLIAVEALPDIPGEQLMTLGSIGTGGGFLARVADKGKSPVPLFALVAGPDQLANDLFVGSLDERPASPCDEMALAFGSESVVHVYTPCRKGMNGNELNLPPMGPTDLPQVLLPDVAVPGGEKVTGLRAGRINADAHLDLLIGTASGIFVAWGVGDGTFNSTLPLPMSAGNGQAAPYTLVTNDPKVADFPLALGDLNLDNVADFVLPKAVVMSRPDGTYVVSVYAPQAWTVGRVADLDGNGLRDVIAASGSAIDFYNGTGTRLLNHATYTAPGPVGFLTTGDVDGDLVNDAVFRASETDPTSGMATQDDLTIMFGHALAYPDAPVVVGRLPTITEIAVAPFEQSLVNQNEPADAIADIAVVSQSAPGSLLVSALAGRADRELTSPFFLVDGQTTGQANGVRALLPTLFATGPFLPGAKPAIAALAYDPLATDGTKLGLSRMWIAPLLGAESIDSTNIRPSATLPAMLDFERAPRMVAVDLDDPSAGGVAEIVAVVPPIGGAAGAILVMRVVNGIWTGDALPFGGGGTFRDWRVEGADVDGDGAEDVVVLYGAGTGATRKITVLWNTRSGKLDPSVANDVPLPAADAAPLAFACVNLDRDPALEIVMVTAQAAYVAKRDAGARTFSNAPTLVAGVGGGTAMTAADVDGDGVPDLAIASGNTLSIYPSTPIIK